MSATETSPALWHSLPSDTVETRLGTGDEGLDLATIEERQGKYGPNEIAADPPTRLLTVILNQFKSPLIYILLAAAVVTFLLGEYLDAGFIAAALALNSIIGVVEERRAESAVRALTKLIVPRARVVRAGNEYEIDSRDLVPGDVVLLEPGSRIPADLRLTATTNLQVDESLLTGESVPVTKQSQPVERSSSLADRRSMAFTGSIVTSGRGRGVAVAIGDATELGSIAGLVRGEDHALTPLQQRMAHLAKLIGVMVGIGCVVTFTSGVALGRDPGDMFLTVVALAVACIPEGLPVVFTITMALGVHRMAQHRAIVRRLPAVETLGSTTVIGSDKTGTLTQNRMEVQTVWVDGRYHSIGTGPLADGEDQPDPPHPRLVTELLEAGVLANEASVFVDDGTTNSTGDPTEVALLLAASSSGVDPDAVRERHPMVVDLPFEPERRYSASVHRHHDRLTVYAKGAPERIVEMCSAVATADGPAPIDRAAVQAAADGLAGRGLRVLAMARLELDSDQGDPAELDLTSLEGLTLIGLQGMHDPPRPGVAEAIAQCHRSGIRVLMITGDHAATAQAIAVDLGIAGPDDPVVTGADLAAMDDDELSRQVAVVPVYARVAPEEKLRIVTALADRGEVVAVTGDGVNDAPALKAAAIGIAMGKSGTDVARAASDMVLTDDDFVSITRAVEVGRITFANVRNVTFFLVSTAVATMIAIVVSVWLQWPLLLLPAQLLWINLVTDGLQDVALAFEPGEKGSLERPPRRRDEGILTPILWERIGVVGLTMAVGTMVMFQWELDRSGSLLAAQSVALTTMVVFQAFHVGNSRSQHRSVFQLNPLANRFLFVTAIVAIAVHIAALYLPPTQYVLRVEPITAEAWIRLVPVATTVLMVCELHKLIRRSPDHHR